MKTKKRPLHSKVKKSVVSFQSKFKVKRRNHVAGVRKGTKR